MQINLYRQKIRFYTALQPIIVALGEQRLSAQAEQSSRSFSCVICVCGLAKSFEFELGSQLQNVTGGEILAMENKKNNNRPQLLRALASLSVQHVDEIDKTNFDNVSNSLYNLIKNSGLSIINYSPSRLAIDKKTIILPDGNDQIIIEKIPIDIEIRGSYLDFGECLESMAASRYRLTASHIEILKQGKERQTTTD